MTALLPCPFCGAAPMILSVGERGQGTMIQCVTDDCVSPHVSYYGAGEAERRWNLRAAPASPRSLGVSQDEPPPPAEPPVEGWRGIESAPRDGRHFFATGPQFAREEDRPEIVAPGTWFIGLARRVGDTIETESWRFKAAAITHWMPLPSPPLSAKDTSERNDLAGDDDKAKPSTSLGGGSRASVASSSLPDGRSAPQRKSEGEG